MRAGIYKIADRRIEIHSIFDSVHEYCSGYRADAGAVDILVEISPEDIAFERRKSYREAKAEGRKPVDYADEYLEKLAVYRKIAEEMPKFDTFLFHGSVIAVDGEAFLFTAKSGTGKSTHTRLWRKRFGDRAVMVNDDKPLIHIGRDGQVVVYGTPWDGKHHLSTNISVPLKAVCILERSAENHIRSAEVREVWPLLLQQTYRPAGPAMMIKTLELLDSMIDVVSMYRLGCNMDPEAADVAYEGMKKK